MNGNFIRAEKQRYSNEEIPTPPPAPLLLGIRFSIFYQPPTTPTPQLLILKFFPTPYCSNPLSIRDQRLFAIIT